MSASEIWQVGAACLGGLGLFLFGMMVMTEALRDDLIDWLRRRSARGNG